MESAFLKEIENDSFFEESLDNAYMELIQASANFTEGVYEEGYITEKAYDTFTTKLKKFFAEVINALKKFKDYLKQQIMATVRKKEYNRRLHKLREELREKSSLGIAYIETTDIISLANTYIDMVDDLKRYSIKFSKMKYSTVTEIERDIDSYKDKVEDYEKKLEKLMDKKIKMSTQKMLNFVEREISDQSHVMMTIADCMDTIEQIEDQVDSLEKKKDIIGADILTRHTGGIRYTVRSFSLFVKKWVVKVITTVVFVFA